MSAAHKLDKQPPTFASSCLTISVATYPVAPLTRAVSGILPNDNTAVVQQVATALRICEDFQMP